MRNRVLVVFLLLAFAAPISSDDEDWVVLSNASLKMIVGSGYNETCIPDRSCGVTIVSSCQKYYSGGFPVCRYDSQLDDNFEICLDVGTVEPDECTIRIEPCYFYYACTLGPSGCFTTFSTTGIAQDCSS